MFFSLNNVCIPIMKNLFYGKKKAADEYIGKSRHINK